MVGHLDRLPREVVTASSLTEFKKCLDNALRHIGVTLGVSCAGPGVGVQ